MKNIFILFILILLIIFTSCDEPNKYGDFGKKGQGGGFIFFSEGGQFKECSGELGQSTWSAAVTTANNYKGGGYSDWSLPSRSELDLMYKNLKKNDLGGFSKNGYWSSEKRSDNSSWALNFLDGGESWWSNDNSYSVRAVRSYTNESDHKTKLLIKNESFTEISDVVWNNITFPISTTQNSIKSGSSVTKNVEEGSGYIFFKRVTNPINARTRDLIKVEKDESKEFKFSDNLIIVDIDNPNNTGTLQTLQPIQTKLIIKNESFIEITDVIWQGANFANNQYENSIKPGTTVTNIVEPGGGFIFFKRKSNPVTARTSEIVIIEKYNNKEFVFRDNTNIFEVNNSKNSGTLSSLKNTVVWWDDAEGELQPYYERTNYVGYYENLATLPYKGTSNSFYEPKNGKKSIAIGGANSAKLHFKINIEKKAKISFWYANRANGTAGTVFTINGTEEKKWITDINWSFMEYELSPGMNDIIWQKNDGYYYNLGSYTSYFSLDDILIKYIE